IRKAKAEYNAIMLDAAQEFVELMDDGKGYAETFANEAKRAGWVMSGAFYLTLARLQGAVYTKAAEIPEIEEMNLSKLGRSNTDAALYLKNEEAPKGVLDDFEAWWNTHVGGIFAGIDKNSVKAGQTKPEFKTGAELLSWLLPDSVFGMLLSAFEVD